MRKYILLSIFSIIMRTHQESINFHPNDPVKKAPFLPASLPVNYTKRDYNFNPNDYGLGSRRTFTGWIQDPRSNQDTHYNPPYLINYNPISNQSADPITKVLIRPSGKRVPLTPSQHVKSHPHHNHGHNFPTHQHDNDAHHRHGHDDGQNPLSVSFDGDRFGTNDGKGSGQSWPTKSPKKWIYFPTPTPRKPITTHSPYENQLPLDHQHAHQENEDAHTKGGTAINRNGVINGVINRGVISSSLDPFNYDFANFDTLDSSGLIRETIGDIKGGGSTRSPRTFPGFSGSNFGSSSSSGTFPASGSSLGKELKFEKDIYERFQEICLEIRGSRCDGSGVNDILIAKSSSNSGVINSSNSGAINFSSAKLVSPSSSSSSETIPDPDFL